jgi:hypothetical protein
MNSADVEGGNTDPGKAQTVPTSGARPLFLPPDDAADRRRARWVGTCLRALFLASRLHDGHASPNPKIFGSTFSKGSIRFQDIGTSPAPID